MRAFLPALSNGKVHGYYGYMSQKILIPLVLRVTYYATLYAFYFNSLQCYR